jgi:hypothetical protein
MRFVVSLLLIFSFTSSFSQVNTERYFQDYKSEGFMYSNSFGFNFATGNTNYFELSNRFRLDFNGPDQDYFAITEYTYRTANSRKSSNKGFLHLRTIRDLGDSRFLLVEGYTQIQFDEFLLLRNRMLLGGGFRFNPVALLDSISRKENKLKIFLGSGVFYEFEKYSIYPTEKSSLMRSSNYLSFVWSASKHININLVNYYQPALEDFTNFRYALNLALSTQITGKLFYELRLEFTHRSVPFAGRKPSDLDVKNNLRFSF